MRDESQSKIIRNTAKALLIEFKIRVTTSRLSLLLLVPPYSDGTVFLLILIFRFFCVKRT